MDQVESLTILWIVKKSDVWQIPGSLIRKINRSKILSVGILLDSQVCLSNQEQLKFKYFSLCSQRSHKMKVYWGWLSLWWKWWRPWHSCPKCRRRWRWENRAKGCSYSPEKLPCSASRPMCALRPILTALVPRRCVFYCLFRYSIDWIRFAWRWRAPNWISIPSYLPIWDWMTLPAEQMWSTASNNSRMKFEFVFWQPLMPIWSSSVSTERGMWYWIGIVILDTTTIPRCTTISPQWISILVLFRSVTWLKVWKSRKCCFTVLAGTSPSTPPCPYVDVLFPFDVSLTYS